MTFTFEETPESRAQQYDTGANHMVTRIYKAVGEQDDQVVALYAANNVDATVSTIVGLLYLRQIRLRPDGFQQYFVEVDYVPPSISSIPKGSYTFTFDTTGGTVNIKTAFAHIGTYDHSGAVANDANSGVIGVKDDSSVEGADIVVPKLKFAFAFKYPSGIVTIAFMKALASITGRMNSNRFLTFDPGELLFLGATGADGSQTERELTFAFEASENAINLVVGDNQGGTGAYSVTIPNKLGHDYVWESHQDVVVDGVGRTVIKEAHVERVYKTADFASYFQWNIYTG